MVVHKCNNFLYVFISSNKQQHGRKLKQQIWIKMHIFKIYKRLSFLFSIVAMKNLRKLNLNSTHLSAVAFEGLKVCNLWIYFIQVILPNKPWRVWVVKIWYEFYLKCAFIEMMPLTLRCCRRLVNLIIWLVVQLLYWELIV